MDSGWGGRGGLRLGRNFFVVKKIASETIKYALNCAEEGYCQYYGALE
jgi:hypothetical protein